MQIHQLVYERQPDSEVALRAAHAGADLVKHREHFGQRLRSNADAVSLTGITAFIPSQRAKLDYLFLLVLRRP